MVESMGTYYENTDNISTPQEAKTWTEKSKDSKLNEILHKLNDEEKKKPDNDKFKKIQKLQNLLIKGEYSQFQKEIGLTNCDGKLGGETLDKLEKFLKLSHHKEYVPTTNNSKREAEQRKDEAEAEEKLSRYINGDETSNGSLDRETPGTNTATERTDVVSKELILKERPSLNVLGKKLEFDPTSKLSFIKPHLDDLSQLSNQSLLKLKKTVKSICISDKTVTSRKSNESLLRIDPRGYSENSGGWKYVGGCFRGGVVYAGRYMRRDGNYYNYHEVCGDNKEGTNSLILHEIGHAFDEKYDISTKPSFKNFHKRFYDKIGSYFQQGGPGGTAGCSEFFAEASAEFHKWGKEGFTKYYSQDFYDYMKDILC